MCSINHTGWMLWPSQQEGEAFTFSWLLRIQNKQSYTRRILHQPAVGLFMVPLCFWVVYRGCSGWRIPLQRWRIYQTWSKFINATVQSNKGSSEALQRQSYLNIKMHTHCFLRLFPIKTMSFNTLFLTLLNIFHKWYSEGNIAKLKQYYESTWAALLPAWIPNGVESFPTRKVLCLVLTSPPHGGELHLCCILEPQEEKSQYHVRELGQHQWYWNPWNQERETDPESRENDSSKQHKELWINDISS